MAGVSNNIDNFNVRIVNEAITSVILEWNHITNAEVYKVEKYHKVHGWEKVAWASENRAIVEHLDDNFAYRLRIKALKYDRLNKAYVDFEKSTDFVATTQAALPTNICLQRAIKKAQQFLVKRILRKRPNLIEYPAPNGYLPMANAIILGEISIVDALLTMGANVHIGNPQNGRTPLHLAFYYGRLSVARMLLNKKANLEASDINGMTPSHFAIDANQSELLKFGLESGANTEAADNTCGWTLLLRAVAMHADVSIIKLLLMHGANTKAVDKLGQNCVMLARLYKNEEATKYLNNSIKIKE